MGGTDLYILFSLNYERLCHLLFKLQSSFCCSSGWETCSAYVNLCFLLHGVDSTCPLQLSQKGREIRLEGRLLKGGGRQASQS